MQHAKKSKQIEPNTPSSKVRSDTAQALRLFRAAWRKHMDIHSAVEA
jgi:hypothetical protein